MTSQDYSALFSGLSALIALAALVAVVWFGVLNLRQARRGPDRAPAWSLARGSGDTVFLTNAQDAGPAFDVDIVPPATPAFRAETHHDRVDPGGRVTMVLRFTGGMGPTDQSLTVTYRSKPDGQKETWTSNVPR